MLPKISHDRPDDSDLDVPVISEQLARRQAIQQIGRRRRFRFWAVMGTLFMILLTVSWAFSEYHNAGGWPTNGFSQSNSGWGHPERVEPLDHLPGHRLGTSDGRIRLVRIPEQAGFGKRDQARGRAPGGPAALTADRMPLRCAEKKGAVMGMEGVVERAARPARVSEPFIDLAGVEKTYRMGRLDYPALRGIDLEIGVGELVAIVGPSGSGKTTILNLIAGIDRPTAGTVTVDGRRIDLMSEEELAVWRGEHVGVVFQFFQLLPTLSALENAVLPLDFARRGPKRERFERARRNLALVGLGDKADHLPAELSGGQQQRVAIARALAADPQLIVGDEPTGNLDTVTAAEMFELFKRLNGEGKTVLYVTHDRELAARAHRIVSIRDGLVVAA